MNAHRGGLAVVHPQVVFDGLVDGSRAAEHAGRGATHHDVVLAHLASVEHRVERGHLQGCSSISILYARVLMQVQNSQAELGGSDAYVLYKSLAEIIDSMKVLATVL